MEAPAVAPIGLASDCSQIEFTIAEPNTALETTNCTQATKINPKTNNIVPTNEIEKLLNPIPLDWCHFATTCIRHCNNPTGNAHIADTTGVGRSTDAIVLHHGELFTLPPVPLGTIVRHVAYIATFVTPHIAEAFPRIVRVLSGDCFIDFSQVRGHHEQIVQRTGSTGL